jgi:hypothetical protein
MESREIFLKMREDNKKQEEELAKKIMEGNENLRNTLARIKKDMEKISIHSNVNYDSFDPNNIEKKEIKYNSIPNNKSNYINYHNYHSNNSKENLEEIKEEKVANLYGNLSPNLKQESTELTVERSLSKYYKESPLSYNHKLSEGSITENFNFSKGSVDKFTEQNPINKIPNQRAIMNSTTHMPENNLKNFHKYLKNNKKINSYEEPNLKLSRDSNRYYDEDLENQIINDNNSNNNINNIQSSTEDIVNTSKEQFNQTNKGNYNTVNHTQDLSNYNINNEKNTTSTFYQGDILNNNKNSKKHLNSNNNLTEFENNNYNQNSNKNNINYYRKEPLDHEGFISYKKPIENEPKTLEKISMAQKEYFELKNQIDLLKKEKDFIKNSIENTGYKKPVNIKKIEKQKKMEEEALKKMDNYQDIKTFEDKVMENLNKNVFYFDLGNKDDFGNYVDQVINRSLKAYKYRHCHNCSRLLTNGKSCSFCQKKHHLYRYTQKKKNK